MLRCKATSFCPPPLLNGAAILLRKAWIVPQSFFSPVASTHVTCRGLRTSPTLGRFLKMARRDQKRRQCVAKYEGDRMRLRAIVKNKILPETIQKQASKDLETQPRDAAISRIRSRCVLTGRGRGVLREYRLSRMKFRQFADFGKLAGVTRSSW